jgi:hypothetical protein
VFGAQAVVAYGVPRLSADVDVTVQLTPHDPPAFVREMNAAGFSLRAGDDFIRQTRVLPFVHVASGMPLDVVLAGSGLEDDFFSRTRILDLDGTAVPILHPEDLIIAKVLAGRPKDTDDARQVWRLHRQDLDGNRIRTVLRELQTALGQSDLVPSFETMTQDD